MPAKRKVQRNKEQWLVEFINKHEYKHGAELGVQKGINLRYLIDNVPDLHMIGVDIWSDKSVRWDGTKSEDLVHQQDNVNSGYYKALVEYAATVHPRLSLHRHFTNYAHRFVENNSLDFVFIDAGHEYEDLIEDIDCWYPKVKVGGHIMGHDINQPQVRKAVNQKLGEGTWNWAKKQKIWYKKK